MPSPAALASLAALAALVARPARALAAADPFGGGLPPVFYRARFLDLALWQWAGLLLAPVVAWIVGVLLGRILLDLVGRVVRRTQVAWDDRLLRDVRAPVRVLLMLLVLAGLLPPLDLAVTARQAAEGVLQTLLIAAVAWLVMRAIRFTGDTVNARLAAADGDPALARVGTTRVTVLRRMASVLVTLVAAALILIQFEVVRKVGVSILASAGIAGIVVGFAAQRSIATLLAGLQLSISQPVRIGDTVIVEGEWGWIEEITLTYVVVKIWDLRRLIVPITYFLEKPFQNWTKVSADLLGTVVVHADYTVPIDKVRAEVVRLCKEDERWDGKAAGLVVLDATERTVVLRALVSAADAGKQWDLRCHVREGLVRFLQALDGGRYLPVSRVIAPPDLPAAALAAAGEGAGAPADRK